MLRFAWLEQAEREGVLRRIRRLGRGCGRTGLPGDARLLQPPLLRLPRGELRGGPRARHPQGPRTLGRATQENHQALAEETATARLSPAWGASSAGPGRLRASLSGVVAHETARSHPRRAEAQPHPRHPPQRPRKLGVAHPPRHGGQRIPAETHSRDAGPADRRGAQARRPTTRPPGAWAG
jgi:hypothetical protein